ncbi:hypothetical protein J437_LFUL019398, partial [Ladona fulva]
TENIAFYHTNNPDVKAAVVERVNRTIKSKVWRYFTKTSTHKHIDVLPQIMDSYNNSVDPSIKMTPASVNGTNVYKVWQNLYGKQMEETHQKISKYQVGDHVRMSKERAPFKKGYKANWTWEIFKIEKIILRDPIVYIQKVRFSKSEAFKIDKIIQTRGVGVRKEVLVQWKEYPSKFNSWIRSAKIKSL